MCDLQPARGVLRGRRLQRAACIAVLVLAGVGCTSTPAPTEDGDAGPPGGEASGGPAGESSRWIAPDGDDEATGTRARPWATFTHAFEQLRAGQTLLVGEGVYREQVRNPPLRPGRPDAPVRVVAAPGARPRLEGLLWLRDADHWHLRGLDVTWDEERNDADEHMVKFSGGRGWRMTDAEIFGARSFAAVLVADEPADWRLAELCVHDTHETNGTNQDHLVYVNSGAGAGPGVIEDSLLFGAPNGSGVKLGGPDPDAGGTVRTTVRGNTIVEAAQPVLVAWASSGNVIEGNLLGDAGQDHGAIRGYRLDGEGNVARDNAAFGVSAILSNDPGHRGVEDGGGNEAVVSPQFGERGSCTGYVPAGERARGRGHAAGGP